uniref:Uncharacterized protein LOC104218845 n=1 Tax=Nicotiana sylvestris TaxID=4096 RepID=A0A1U7VZB6_NICSY
MESSKIIDTPIATATRLDIEEPGYLIEETMYRRIIGSLLYLTVNRSDIYLKGMQNLVLYYSSGDNFDLIGYVDADYAGYLVDRKSTSGKHEWKLLDKQEANAIAIFERMMLIFSKSFREPGSHDS